MYFARFADTVTMLVRGEGLSTSMSQYLIEQIAGVENIRVWTRSEVAEARGAEHLEELVISRDGGERTETVDAAAMFIFIGAKPRTDWLGDQVARDEHGFVLSGSDTEWGEGAATVAYPERPPFPLETNVPGLFAAGDVRHGSAKRVASAVGEGSMAVMFVHKYLEEV
jgi:thioredoxin reductase (NADPH)